MPKKMFLNISKEKQKKIINAAIKEFTSKSFEKVSVNSIIKIADIPRGSFYTYFDNLEDLFNYIMVQIKEERFMYARQLITNSNNDFFTFIKKIFAYDFDSYSNKYRYSLFRNYIHYIQYYKKGSLKNDLLIPMVHSIDKGEKLSELFNFKKYKLSINEYLDIMEMSMVLMINTFLKSESENIEKDLAIALFNRRMDIIKLGIIQNKKNEEETK